MKIHILLTGAKRREWMGMGLAGIIIARYWNDKGISSICQLVQDFATIRSMCLWCSNIIYVQEFFWSLMDAFSFRVVFISNYPKNHSKRLNHSKRWVALRKDLEFGFPIAGCNMLTYSKRLETLEVHGEN
jgi:hypothetical protein